MVGGTCTRKAVFLNQGNTAFAHGPTCKQMRMCHIWLSFVCGRRHFTWTGAHRYRMRRQACVLLCREAQTKERQEHAQCQTRRRPLSLDDWSHTVARPSAQSPSPSPSLSRPPSPSSSTSPSTSTPPSTSPYTLPSLFHIPFYIHPLPHSLPHHLLHPHPHPLRIPIPFHISFYIPRLTIFLEGCDVIFGLTKEGLKIWHDISADQILTRQSTKAWWANLMLKLVR